MIKPILLPSPSKQSRGEAERLAKLQQQRILRTT